MNLRVESERAKVIVEGGTVGNCRTGKPAIFRSSLVGPLDKVTEPTTLYSMINDAFDAIFFRVIGIVGLGIANVAIGEEVGVIMVIGFEFGCMKESICIGRIR